MSKYDPKPLSANFGHLDEYKKLISTLAGNLGRSKNTIRCNQKGNRIICNFISMVPRSLTSEWFNTSTYKLKLRQAKI